VCRREAAAQWIRILGNAVTVGASLDRLDSVAFSAILVGKMPALPLPLPLTPELEQPDLHYTRPSGVIIQIVILDNERARMDTDMHSCLRTFNC
jgi:hypothetical protein